MKHVGAMRRIRRTVEPGEGRKGMALLLALIMIVLITAFITEFNYSARVKILGAAHSRDDAKALFLARGGVRVYALLLVVGRQSTNNPMIEGLLSQVGLSIDGAAMVCRSVPFLDTAMLRFLADAGGSLNDEEEEGLLGLMGIGGGDNDRGSIDELAEGQETIRRSILDFEGDFKVDCADESGKLDLNGFSNNSWMALPLEQHPTAQLLYGMFAPREYDPLFEERLKMDRWELIGNIRDWIDADTQRSGLYGGDEDGLYSDYEPRYRAKNAKLDSLAEVRMVHGVTDEVWETWKDVWSIHTQNFKINVNAVNVTTIRALLRAFTDPLFDDQALDAKMMEIMFSLKALPGPARNANDFVNRVKGAGIPLIPELESTLKGLVATDSRIFRLSATGYVNDSTSTIEAVMRVRRNSVRYLDYAER